MDNNAPSICIFYRYGWLFSLVCYFEKILNGAKDFFKSDIIIRDYLILLSEMGNNFQVCAYQEI